MSLDHIQFKKETRLISTKNPDFNIGRVVWALDLQSNGPGFDSRSDHWPTLICFTAVP